MAHFAIGVKTGLQVVLVKLDLKGLQVQVLLVAQVGHGKFTDVVQVIHVGVGRHLAIVCRHGFFCQKIPRDVSDVFTVVSVFWPWRIPRFDAFGTALGRQRQRLNLHARIVVIKLAVHLPTLGVEQLANRVAQSRLSAMPHMQWTGGVGRHKFHQQALTVRSLPAVTGPR